MYSAFERHGFTTAGRPCAEQLVILDGLGGLLSVAKSFHEVEADEDASNGHGESPVR